MNLINKYIIRSIAAISLCVNVVSCERDEFGMLPDNERMLKFTASVDEMVTRAVETDFWAAGDEIRVRIRENNDDSTYYPWVGKYALNTDGSVKDAIEALAWPYEYGFVSAWYPFLQEGEEVLITDQSKGYHSFDFLEAHTDPEKKMNYKDIVDLNFKHQMTKVSCKFIKGDGVTEEDLKTAEIKYFGYSKVKFSEAGIEGEGSRDYITPASDFSALLAPQDVKDQPFITVDLTLTINDARIPKTLVYTPQETMNLEAGSAYIFNITVQKDRLEVKTISGTWTESLENTTPTPDTYHIYLEDTGDLGDLYFSNNVTEKSADTRAGSVRSLEVLGDEFTIFYKVTADNCHLGIVYDNEKTENKLNEVKRTYYEKLNSENTTDNTSDASFDDYYEFSYKIVSPFSDPVYLKKGEHIEVGDYIFNDGKWGSIPAKIYEKKKTPVGIVFKVGAGGEKATLDVPSNYGWNENVLEIRGYAVALNDASASIVSWGPNTTLESIVNYDDHDLENCIAQIRYSGIITTKKAKEKGITKYPAFKAATEFKAKGESPTDPIAGSSGWYLPSYLQLTDVRDLFKHPQRGELITNAGGSLFSQHNKRTYCTATERYSTMIWLQSFVYSSSSDPNSDTGITKTKTYSYFVRSVLTLSKSAE